MDANEERNEGVASTFGEQLARALFVRGREGKKLVQRIQFLAGKYPHNEIPLGGFCETALANFIDDEISRAAFPNAAVDAELEKIARMLGDAFDDYGFAILNQLAEFVRSRIGQPVRDPARDELVKEIAAIAHHGAIMGFPTEFSALREIRRITLEFLGKAALAKLGKE